MLICQCIGCFFLFRAEQGQLHYNQKYFSGDGGDHCIGVTRTIIDPFSHKPLTTPQQSADELQITRRPP